MKIRLTATHERGDVRRAWEATLDRHHELQIIESLEAPMVCWTVSMPSGHTIATAKVTAPDMSMAFDRAIDEAVAASAASLI